MNDFVELPENLLGINYSGVIAGAIRGALATVNIILIKIDSLDSLMHIHQRLIKRWFKNNNISRNETLEIQGRRVI